MPITVKVKKNKGGSSKLSVFDINFHCCPKEMEFVRYFKQQNFTFATDTAFFLANS